jgi:(1->4)-alpha-D-glucan 1-alpha-D-glucosylmutase
MEAARGSAIKAELPDRNDEYLLYQTLVGAWPITEERIQKYMEKACREAKTHTSWTDPNPDYENAVQTFVKAVFRNRPLIADLEVFVSRLAQPGWINSLSQTLVKLTSPGVPDLYQGTELWAYDLVDPDNRRPVDYNLRRRLLAELDNELAAEDIWERAGEGLPKLWVIRQALSLRKKRPELFGEKAGYQALPANDAHALAYARLDPDGAPGIAVVIPRLVLTHPIATSQTEVELPHGTWQNVLTGEETQGGMRRLSVILSRFPVALFNLLSI